jgi:hypothetical protein
LPQSRRYSGALPRVQGRRALSADDIAEAVRLALQALEAARDDADTIWQAAWTLFYLAGEEAMAAAALDRALGAQPERGSSLSPFDRHEPFRNSTALLPFARLKSRMSFERAPLFRFTDPSQNDRFLRGDHCGYII